MITQYLSNPILLVSIVITIVIAFTLHEYGHAYVAYKNGDSTAKYQGRLTINPLKHIDLFGFLMLMVAGFGYAKPVPVNPLNFKHLRRGIFTTAIAGVTINAGLAFVSMPFAYLFGSLYVYNGTMVYYYITQFFILFVTININLILFNLLPIYPLDGFRIVESFTKRGNKFVRFMMQYGFYILIALVLLGVVVDLMQSRLDIPWYMDFLYAYIRLGSYIFWPLDKLWSSIFGIESLFYYSLAG